MKAFTPPNTNEIVRELNKYYSTHHIVFNNAGSRFVDDSDLVYIDDSEAIREITDAGSNGTFTNRYGESDVINYFIVDYITVSSAFVTDIPSNSLFINSNSVLKPISAHELGYCLGLAHTFRGFPVGLGFGSCAEAIDGSNCKTCGDVVCDTPADQNMGNTGGYTPDLTNIMSYYIPSDHFTSGQGQRMRTALANEAVLSSVNGNSCVRISKVDNICYPNGTSKTVTLTNLGNTTTTWTSSSNVQIVSSNTTSVAIKASDGNRNRVGKGDF